MGSLLTALASFLDIKARGGEWYVRIDNLDPPREDPKAVPQILEALNAHGLSGDKPVDYQGDHDSRYAQAFQALHDHLFYCDCTRKALAGQAVYPGTCRAQREALPSRAARIEVRTETVTFKDGRLGPQQCPLAEDYGDFIVKRRDGLWAYNFATAVDDGMDVTHVLRGQDLFHVTAQQVFVMQCLELAPPCYTHIPVLCYADGTKLSKQTHAPPLDNARAAGNLHDAFHYLGMNPPSRPDWNVAQWLTWGQQHWNLARLPEQLPCYPAKLS